MRNKKKISILIIISIFLIGLTCVHGKRQIQAAKKYKTYTVSPNTSPCDNSKKSEIYNKYTKHYFMLRSYLVRLEKEGGGTLVLTKGNYTICNSLYIPDNVTIKLKKGVVVKKGTKTGTKKLTPACTIFVSLPDSKKHNKKSIKKQGASQNIAIVGEGNATIDLAYYKGAIGVTVGHSKNVLVDGVNFKNMNQGHFIELDASKNVTIKNCTFTNHKDSKNNDKEAINIDTPDSKTKGFNVEWSAQDKTPNTEITIQNNTFKNLERAIGTHKYSQGKLHSNIKISGNMIDGCDSDAIRIMNWKKVVIQNNKIEKVGKIGDTRRGINISGASNIKIHNNTFENMSRAFQFMPWKNTGNGSEYKIIYNKLTEAEIKTFQENTYKKVRENFIRVNTIYNEFVNGTTKYLIEELN